MYLIQGTFFCNNVLDKNSFSLIHVQCMSELCCKIQIPTSNTVGGDAVTRTVLQCDMVQNMYVIQGDVILQ